MTSETDNDRKELKGIQLAALGVCTFILVVVGGLLVLNASGGLKRVDPAPAAASQ